MGIAIPVLSRLPQDPQMQDADARRHGGEAGAGGAHSRHRFTQPSQYILAVVRVQQRPMMVLERRTLPPPWKAS
ncbi:MAG TPA: hypothetical protein VFI62_10330 [Burkholderiales bacterium]|nr:hypothetical protein [Burkholderiales bacterium]